MENERENKLRRWIDVDSKSESEMKRVTQRERERERQSERGSYRERVSKASNKKNQ